MGRSISIEINLKRKTILITKTFLGLQNCTPRLSIHFKEIVARFQNERGNYLFLYTQTLAF